MKNKKRNITMIAVLVFVCAAVALNWSYNNRWGHPDSEMVSAEDSAMLDAAAADAEAAPAEEINVCLNTGSSPCILVPADGSDNFVYMVLPVRLRAGQ